jgi:hypothetical protein
LRPALVQQPIFSQLAGCDSPTFSRQGSLCIYGVLSHPH